ncbi:MAG: serpin family protein [Pseudomonadota bacterium]
MTHSIHPIKHLALRRLLGFLIGVAIQPIVAVPSSAAPDSLPAAYSGQITANQLQLGVTLLQKATAVDNRALSPYSIHAGLTLARIGAVGATGANLDTILFSSPFSEQTISEYASLNAEVESKNDSSIATLANSVWITSRGSFTGKYLAKASRGFSAEPRTIDFQASEQARRTINEWVASKTKSLIPNLLPAGMPSPHTTAVLVNALYFKAAWDNAFNKSATKEESFNLSSGDVATTPMMHLTASMRYFENCDWQAVQLTYAHGGYFYLVLLPRNLRTSQQVADSLRTELINTAIDSAVPSRIALTIPRHKIRFSRDLTEPISSITGPLPFSSSADYSGMTVLPTSISAIMHETVVNVDEAGTEAAAATAMVMTKSAFFVEDEPKSITVDRPFAFAIMHKQTRAPLVIGVVGDPRG